MKPTAFVLTFGLLVLIARDGIPQEREPGALRAGMTATEVRRLRGEPDRIARQHLNRRYLEQWLYLHPTLLRVEFHGVKGQEARVVQVHPLRQ